MKISRNFYIFLASLGCVAHCQKTLFKEDIGIHLNIPMADMDAYTADFDKLTLLFLFDSEKNKS